MADPAPQPDPLHPLSSPSLPTGPRARDRLLARVLRTMRALGPLTADDLARLCLPMDQVVAAMPAELRERRVYELIGGLTALLDEDGTETTLLAAVAQMRLAEHRTRDALVWTDLPPVLRQAAIRAARQVIDHALPEEWVAPMRNAQGAPAWRITPLGGGELDRLDRAARA